MRFGVLGPLEVSGQDGLLSLGGPKQRIVLAHLVLSANKVVSAERLIDALWGEDPPDEPRSTLQVYVSRLRSVLVSSAARRSSGFEAGTCAGDSEKVRDRPIPVAEAAASAAVLLVLLALDRV